MKSRIAELRERWEGHGDIGETFDYIDQLERDHVTETFAACVTEDQEVWWNYHWSPVASSADDGFTLVTEPPHYEQELAALTGPDRPKAEPQRWTHRTGDI